MSKNSSSFKVGPSWYLWGQYCTIARRCAARPDFETPRPVLGSHVLKARVQRGLCRRRVVAVHILRERFAADWSLLVLNAELRLPLWKNAR